MAIEAVLLDMGGVLLDMRSTNGVPPRALDFRGRQALLGALDVPEMTLDELDRLVFEPWRSGYRERYRRGREAGWEEPLDRLRQVSGTRLTDREMLAAWFGPFGESLEPVPGAPEAVETLARAGLRLGVVSNVPLPGSLYRAVLERCGMAESVGAFEFSYDSGHRKPSPYMLRSALQTLQVAPERAVMVGDRKASDVAAGRAAGTATVWVRSEYRTGPEADLTVGSLAHLPELVERLGR